MLPPNTVPLYPGIQPWLCALPGSSVLFSVIILITWHHNALGLHFPNQLVNSLRVGSSSHSLLNPWSIAECQMHTWCLDPQNVRAQKNLSIISAPLVLQKENLKPRKVLILSSTAFPALDHGSDQAEPSHPWSQLSHAMIPVQGQVQQGHITVLTRPG